MNKTRVRTHALWLSVLASVACTAERDDDNPWGDSGIGTSGDDGDSGADKFDVAQGGTGQADDGGSEEGCTKVDFLFVIDNSGSMADEQQNLVASFPGFISAIQATLSEVDSFHVMIVDTDEWQFAACHEGKSHVCNYQPCCDVEPAACESVGFTCGVDQMETCEDVLGAGITHPKGKDSSEADCGFASGNRFMSSAEPDLPGVFSCAARVGTGSTLIDEWQMGAMVGAVSPTLNADGACNGGFLRDDAILVVTFITDEEDKSVGDPASWKQALVEAKGGDESAIVVLGLFGDNDLPNATCQPLIDETGAEPAPKLRQFLSSWGDRGIFGPVCAPSYDAFFHDAVAIIDNACDEFLPQG